LEKISHIFLSVKKKLVKKNKEKISSDYLTSFAYKNSSLLSKETGPNDYFQFWFPSKIDLGKNATGTMGVMVRVIYVSI